LIRFKLIQKRIDYATGATPHTSFIAVRAQGIEAALTRMPAVLSQLPTHPLTRTRK
jgi:hypothetical protein